MENRIWTGEDLLETLWIAKKFLRLYFQLIPGADAMHAA